MPAHYDAQPPPFFWFRLDRTNKTGRRTRIPQEPCMARMGLAIGCNSFIRKYLKWIRARHVLRLSQAKGPMAQSAGDRHRPHCSVGLASRTRAGHSVNPLITNSYMSFQAVCDWEHRRTAPYGPEFWRTATAGDSAGCAICWSSPILGAEMGWPEQEPADHDGELRWYTCGER